MYRNKMIDENTLKTKCSDSDPQIIYKELEIYISDIIQDNLIFDKKKYYRLKNKKIWFSGDNLITRKQMYLRINKKKKLDSEEEERIKNDREFTSYIVLPFIKGNRYSNVNVLRASTGGYNDNPFVFFEVLREMFLCGFSLKCDTCDAVKKAIIMTKDYWNLFGEEENGWECYKKTFGLGCLEELKKEVVYKKYFTEGNDKYDWEEYNNLLNKFKDMRFKELSSNN